MFSFFRSEGRGGGGYVPKEVIEPIDEQGVSAAEFEKIQKIIWNYL